MPAATEGKGAFDVASNQMVVGQLRQRLGVRPVIYAAIALAAVATAAVADRLLAEELVPHFAPETLEDLLTLPCDLELVRARATAVAHVGQPSSSAPCQPVDRE